MHGSARTQEFEKAVVALSKLGNFPVDLVERALLDEHEDMILILAKAAGCSWTTARELTLMRAAGTQIDARRSRRCLRALQDAERGNRAEYRQVLRPAHGDAQRVSWRDVGKSDAAKPAAKAAKKKQPVAHAPAPAEGAASRI